MKGAVASELLRSVSGLSVLAVYLVRFSSRPTCSSRTGRGSMRPGSTGARPRSVCCSRRWEPGAPRSSGAT